MEKAAAWESTAKDKSPRALFLDVRGKLAMSDPRLAGNPAKLDAVTRKALAASTAFADAAKAPASTEHFTPKTQEDFAAIPPGSTYIDPDDGKVYRKP